MSGEKPERDVVVPEPQGRARIVAPIACLVWVLVMLGIPAGYYAGSDRYDERFAWRMFSKVRVARCQVQVTEQRSDGEHAVPLLEVLPAPWFELLKRNRPAVIREVLHWRCAAREDTREVRFHNECLDPTGAPMPDVDRTLDCARGELRERGE